MCHRKITRILLNWIGVGLAVFGVCLLFTWNALITSYINKQLALTPTSPVFPIWQKSVQPVNLEVYLFNCTNTHELTKPDFKPNVVEVGPFAFKEFNEKVDIKWNDNNTVSYRQKRTWYFDKERSGASMEENITTLNIVPVAASYKARFLGYWAAWSLSASMKVLEKSIWTTRPAKEYLFEGYSDPLMTLSSVFSGDNYDKMGFFYRKNGSSVTDGHFNMETGAEDMSTIGLLRRWNFRNRTHAFDEGCDDVLGYLGQFFKPGIKKEDTFDLFTTEICRTMPFKFVKEQEVHDVKGYRFDITKSLMDNGYHDEESKCNCGGVCMAPGVLNTSKCTRGAPMFASYPHFLDAHESYLEKVTGLSPSRNRSSFHIVLEPTLGIPLELSAHLQQNLLLQPNPKLSLFSNVPTVLLPMMYIKKKFVISEESAQKVKLILFLPTVGTVCAIALILLGLIMLSISLMPYIRNRFWSSPNWRMDISTDVTFSQKQEISFNKKGSENRKENELNESEYQKLKAAEDVKSLKDAKETDILT